MDKTENLQFQVCLGILLIILILLFVDLYMEIILNASLCAIQADSFQRQGRQLRRKMWFQNVQLKLIVGGSIVAFIVIVWLVACRGFKC